MKITYGMVFAAQEAVETELKAWTIVEHVKGGPVMVHDMHRRMAVPNFKSVEMLADKVAFTRKDMKDRVEAERYIRWRAWEAGLNAALNTNQAETYDER